MCQFENIEIGTKITFRVTKGWCSLSDKNYAMTFDAVYHGHFTDGETYDLLVPIGELKCPNCGELIKRYRVPCCTGALWPFVKTEVSLNH